MIPSRLRALGASVALVTVSLACGDKKSTPTSPTTGPTMAPVAAVGLTLVGAPTASIGVGQTVYLRAVEVLNNGGTHAVSGVEVQWSSSAADVASITADGSVVARMPGSTTVTASYLSHSASTVIRVVANWIDLDFRVAILNGTSSVIPASDVSRIFSRASDLLFERTGARMRLMDMRDVGPETPARLATVYMESLSGELPDGVLVWSEDATAVTYGGYAQTLIRPAPYSNRYPATNGSNRLFVTAVHYTHKYARCGYDTTGELRISDRSANGECRNRSGLVCVDNGRFWECPDVRDDFYAQPDVFTASTIVHEFLHPVGLAGNDDHYGTPTCVARVGMSASDASDLARAQWNLGQCPDLFLRFRPAGVPNAAGRLGWR